MRKNSKIAMAAAALAVAAGVSLLPQAVRAQDWFVGQIIPVPFNFCPRGFAETNGQLLPLSQNTALFSLLGTTYGGDGKSNFALPDMRGRLPMHVGDGPGLTPRLLGETTGTASNTLLSANLPAHSHNPQMRVVAANANLRNSVGAYIAQSQNNSFESATQPTGNVMAVDAIQSNSVGGGQPVNNIQPSLVIRYCIALQGVFPPPP